MRYKELTKQALASLPIGLLKGNAAMLPVLPDAAAIDPVLVAIIRNRLDAIAEEMAQTLMMTSRSGIFAEARDFVTGICDAEGRLVAQSRYFPGFACALPYLFPPCWRNMTGRLDDGDVIIVNDPYQGNSHLPDMNILKPVFAERRLAFWAVCKGHMADIGGGGVAGYDPLAETVWDEGLIIPPSKLCVRGELDEEFLALILTQLKLPDIVRGDILCEVGGAEIGARGIAALIGKYGLETVDAHVNAFLDASEKAMRARIAAMPEGVYRGEKAIDDDVASDTPLTIRVDRHGSRRRGHIRFQRERPAKPALYELHRRLHPLHGRADAVRHAGARRKQSRRAAPAAFRQSARPLHQRRLPGLDGGRHLLDGRMRAGGRAACPRPGGAGQGRRAERQAGLPADRLYRPGKAAAERECGLLLPRATLPAARSASTAGSRAARRRKWAWAAAPTRKSTKWCIPCASSASSRRSTAPAPGAYRGGNGHVYRVQHLAPSVKATVFGSGTKPHAVPIGMCGGRDPAPSVFAIERAAGGRETIRLNSFFEVGAGDIIELRAMGGPGYGDPRTRDPERVARDVRDGYVSVAAARETYGVVLDDAGGSR